MGLLDVIARHRPSTMSMPTITWAKFFCDSLPVRSVRKARSTAMICDAFATESFGNPVALADSRTFPGARAHVKLLVSGTQTTVAILLLFRGSPWTTTTGRLSPGPDPPGSGRFAHQTSPCNAPTTAPARGAGAAPPPWRTGRQVPWAHPWLGSWLL